MNDIEYAEPFEYSSDWYDRIYHERKHHEEYDAKPDMHRIRDENCYRDAEVRPEDDILICGCGGGNNAWSLVNTFGCRKLTLVDFAPAAVAHCQRNFPFAKALVADVSALPFDDNSFDLISALDITEHLPEQVYKLFLREALRVCRPGGRMVVLPGMTRRPEHVNLIPLDALAKDLWQVGFGSTLRFGPEWVIAKKVGG